MSTAKRAYHICIVTQHLNYIGNIVIKQAQVIDIKTHKNWEIDIQHLCWITKWLKNDVFLVIMKHNKQFVVTPCSNPLPLLRLTRAGSCCALSATHQCQWKFPLPSLLWCSLYLRMDVSHHQTKKRQSVNAGEPSISFLFELQKVILKKISCSLWIIRDGGNDLVSLSPFRPLRKYIGNGHSLPRKKRIEFSSSKWLLQFIWAIPLYISLGKYNENIVLIKTLMLFNFSYIIYLFRGKLALLKKYGYNIRHERTEQVNAITNML